MLLLKEMKAMLALTSPQEFETILGYIDEPEMIHRDNLILV